MWCDVCRVIIPWFIFDFLCLTAAYNTLYYHSLSNGNNFAFSPCGLGSVLVALYEGCDGRSAFEIYQTLGFPYERDVLRIGYRDIHRRLRVSTNWCWIRRKIDNRCDSFDACFSRRISIRMKIFCLAWAWVVRILQFVQITKKCLCSMAMICNRSMLYFIMSIRLRSQQRPPLPRQRPQLPSPRLLPPNRRQPRNLLLKQRRRQQQQRPQRKLIGTKSRIRV